MKAVGCHIYAGGFSLGVRKHFDIVAHFEDGKFGTETVEKNLGIPIYQKSDGWPDLGGIHLVYCNPPCAPWSASSVGRSFAWFDDPRVSCVDDCFSLLDRLQPRVWCMESVRGLYNRGKSKVMELVMQAMERGYCAYFILCDAVEHGVPQKRRRFFLVLSQYEIKWSPTDKKPCTSGQVLGKLTRDPDTRRTTWNGKCRWHHIVNKVKPGETMKQTFIAEFPELVGVPKCGRGSFMLRRLDPDGPAQTFTGDVKTFHPTEDRFLTVGEAAVLCGFPRSYRFVGPTGLRYNQMARGVLPPVAEYVADMVATSIKARRKPSQMDPREVMVFRDSIQIRNV